MPRAASRGLRALEYLVALEGAEAEYPPLSGGGTSMTLKGFSQPELTRYARHLALPEVGLAGQKRLKDGRVLCVGAGGLGSPLALYLAAAGVGTIGLVDFDTVDESTLQRLSLIHI